jgi:phosphatidylglycerophosphate synthase
MARIEPSLGGGYTCIMLDGLLRPAIDPALARLAQFAVRAGISANAATMGGFAIGIAAMGLIVVELYGWAIAALLLSRLCDGLDGAIARRTQVSDIGAFLDIALDFIFYAGVVFAFGLARPEANALAAAFLLFSFIGTCATFLAFAIFAGKRGITTPERGPKSIYYLGGLTEGTETLIAFIVACLFPDAFAWIAIVFGALCIVTSGTRIATAWRLLSERVGENNA